VVGGDGIEPPASTV